MARQRQKARGRKRRDQGVDGDGSLRADQPINVSGEVDEFEAAVVSGGETDGTDVEQVSEAVGLGGDGNGGAGGGLVVPGESGGRAPQRRGSGGPRFVVFLKSCWAELQRVQWPDRRQVAQATAVVVGFVIVAGAYLGAADYVAKEVVDWII